MPINKEEVLKQAEKMEQDNAESKFARKGKKERWKSQSLKDSLYNDENDKKIPRDSDIDQASYSHLNYLLKQYSIGDCFLLTNLMGLARTKSSFIMSDLIKIKNDNEVEVGLYGTKIPPDIKIRENAISITFEPTSSKTFYPVTKEEAVAWKTSHAALWPVVIEIAYAKYLKNIAAENKEQLEQQLIIILRPEAEQAVKQRLSILDTTPPTPSEFNEYVESTLVAWLEQFLSNDRDLRQFFKGGFVSATTLTHLTGAKSKTKSFQSMDITKLGTTLDEKFKKEYEAFKGVDTTNIKAFQGEYSPAVIKIYDKIQKKANSGKTITISFKGVNPLVATSTLTGTGLPKVDNKEIAFAVISHSRGLNLNVHQQIENFENAGMIVKKDYEEWLKKNKLTLEELSRSSEQIRKKFILETVNFEKNFKISKTKTGISAAHSYLVLGAFEHEGYKYIVLKNPHDMKTKINYKKSSKLPPEVKLPEQINKVKNECMMELNHFYKKLAAINYDK